MHTRIHAPSKLRRDYGVNKGKRGETEECMQINKPPHGGFHGWLVGDNEPLRPPPHSPVSRLVSEVISVNTRDIYLLAH